MFFTYIALDPRKPGRFQTPFCSFLFQPAYVGKGNFDRTNGINEVLRDPSLKPHSGELLHSWCKKLRKEKIFEVPIIRIAAEDEIHAFAMEEVLTRHLGIIPEKGMLYNGRHGGQGGWQVSGRTKELLSLLNRGENNPNWGKKWSEERRAKWHASWQKKDRTRTPESMQAAWEAKRRTYIITPPNDKSVKVDDLTNWCSENGHPLSAFRKALKADGVVRSGARKKSRVEGWHISYSSQLLIQLDQRGWVDGRRCLHSLVDELANGVVERRQVDVSVDLESLGELLPAEGDVLLH